MWLDIESKPHTFLMQENSLFIYYLGIVLEASNHDLALQVPVHHTNYQVPILVSHRTHTAIYKCPHTTLPP